MPNTKKLEVCKLTDCTPHQQTEVLALRNLESVRQAMFTEHLIDHDEHQSWMSGLYSDKAQLVFVVLDHDSPIGVASFSHINTTHRSCDWAFYLDDVERIGLALALELAIVDYAFNELNMCKLSCEVLETNPAVVRLHKGFGFSEEGFVRSKISKGEQRVGTYLLGMTDTDWKEQRPLLSSAVNVATKLYSLQFVGEKLNQASAGQRTGEFG